MNETRTIKLLRISYWTGAIFDALVLLPMLSPRIASTAFGIPDFNPEADYKYAMYIAASLMLGWIFLLLWADRKPVERRGVLLLTIFPVLVGLIISGTLAVNSTLISFADMIPTWIMQVVLVLLFGFSYLSASHAEVTAR
jgi:hypothetical protein